MESLAESLYFVARAAAEAAGADDTQAGYIAGQITAAYLDGLADAMRGKSDPETMAQKLRNGGMI